MTTTAMAEIPSLAERWYEPSGRLRRRDYAARVLGVALLLSPTIVVPFYLTAQHRPPSGMVVVAVSLLLLGYLAYVWVQSVKRLHDLNLSGWWVLLSQVPGVGFLFFANLFFADGRPHANQYGPDPKGRSTVPLLSSEVVAVPEALPVAFDGENLPTLLSEERWFSWHGRIGRLSYFLRTGGIGLATYISYFALLSELPREIGFYAMLFLAALAVAASSLQTMKRLHDLGFSGAWALLTFVPTIGQLAILYLSIAPGQTGANRFGADPHKDFAGG